jgi:hypothetical protein
MKYIKPTVNDLLKRTKFQGDCCEWSGKKTKNGYGRLKINNIETYAHRAMIVAVTGKPIPDGLCVLHSCDNKCCINPNHLRIGTHAENMRDAIERGRTVYPPKGSWTGTKNPKSVLSETDRMEIVKLFQIGKTATEISEIYPVTAVRCGQIRREEGISLVRKRRWGVKPVGLNL